MGGWGNRERRFPKIQKFLVLYGPPGSGKSTVLNIVQKLFDGYWSVFDFQGAGIIVQCVCAGSVQIEPADRNPARR